MKRIIALAMALVCVATYGCAPYATTAEAEGAPTVASASGERPVPKAAVAAVAEVDAAISEFNEKNLIQATVTSEPQENAPLSIVKSASRCGVCSIIYPRVIGGEAAERINEAVCAAACARVAAIGSPAFTDYSVEYNRNGLFSIRMYIYDLYETNSGWLDSFSLNFNAQTGEQLTVNNLFSKDGKWRGEIPDLIAEQAVETDMVLLSELPPICDDQQFYITSNGIVLTYGLYEIATYSAGEPEFCITVNDVANYVADDSAINCLVAQTQTPTTAPAAAETTPLPTHTPAHTPAAATPTPIVTTTPATATETGAK